MSVSDISTRVTTKLSGARDDLKKAMDIKTKMIKMQKDHDETLKKMETELSKKTDPIADKAELAGKASKKDEAAELVQQVLSIHKDFTDTTEKLNREMKMQLDTLQIERNMLQEKAMRVLTLKSGVDLIKAETKRKDLTKKIEKLTQMQNVKALGDELGVLKNRTSLATKKM